MTATAAASAAQAPNPQVLGGVVPYLQVNGAIAASEFYQRAFGAVEVLRHPPDDKGRTMHVHLHINGGSLMLGDAYPEYGHPLQAPRAFNVTLPVKDIDSWWKRAVAAGAQIVMPLEVMFWGDRYGQLRDPFGVLWALNEPVGK